MRIRPGFEIDETRVAKFCRANGIRRLAVFGSVLGDEFRDDSDIDLLVEFAPGRTPGLLRLASLELELSEMFGDREVELRTSEDLSRLFRASVQASAAPLYEAA